MSSQLLQQQLRDERTQQLFRGSTLLACWRENTQVHVHEQSDQTEALQYQLTSVRLLPDARHLACQTRTLKRTSAVNNQVFCSKGTAATSSAIATTYKSAKSSFDPVNISPVSVSSGACKDLARRWCFICLQTSDIRVMLWAKAYPTVFTKCTILLKSLLF